MANSVSAAHPEYWARRMQRKHYKSDVWRAIANMEEKAMMKRGDVVHRPRRSDLTVADYTRGTAISMTDLTVTDESMNIDQQKVIGFYMDDFDALQSNYRLANEYADEAAVRLGNSIDGDVLGEYDQAASSLTAVTLSTSNVLTQIAAAAKALDAQNVAMDERFAVVSPQFKQVLVEYLAGQASDLGDSTGLNGHIGKFYGFDIHVSNQLGWSGELALATQPTANDTVVVNGVTFTFVASPSAAGDIDLGANVDATRANLEAAINAGSGAGSDYIEVSAADRLLLNNITATNNDTTNVLSLKAEGLSYVVVSETLTDGTDTWTAASQVQHNLFGRKGAIDVVVQSAPKVEFKTVSDKLGKNVLCSTLYGLKTFNEGTKALVDLGIRSDAF